MERKDFIRSVGVVSLSSMMLPLLASCKDDKTPSSSDNNGNCVIIPQETAGPFPLDLHNNPGFFRANIVEGKTGLPLSLTLTIVNVNNNCSPITNARVDVWHCDKDGVYSGYSQPGANTTGQTFLRGIQLTDNSGVVKFTTIYPGWYPGRVTHIHFQVYLNNGLIATSQIAFPENITQLVYNDALYTAHGQNTSVANNADDGVFGNSNSDLQKELCVVVPNTTGGYDATLNVGIAV